MIVYSGTTNFVIPQKQVAVTLGKFDGLHVGHQELMHKILSFKKLGLATAVFTFDFSPMQILSGKTVEYLTSNEEKRYLLESYGVDYLIEYPFNQETINMEAEDFIRNILIEKIHAKIVVVGDDFRFGHNRKGDAELLRKMQEECGYEAFVISKLKDSERDISSTYVKEELQKGNLEKVNQLLAHGYLIKGSVQHGRNLAAGWGIPTINIYPAESKLLPPYGVYFSNVYINGVCYNGVTNVGRKPTISANDAVCLETHLFDVSEDLYEKDVIIELKYFLRPEKRFENLELLKEQIYFDAEEGKKYFKSIDKY